MYLLQVFLILLNFGFIKGSSINFNDIEFFLYTKNFPKYPQQLFVDDNITLNLSDFKSSRNTFILIHEWGTGMRSIHLTPIKLALLQNTEDFNIIVVNWHSEATLSYPVTRKLVPDIGEYIGRFIYFLSAPNNSKLSQFYVITYGLGAHIAANIHLKTKRIIALNPQNELFSKRDTDKLNSNSADCVETIFANSKYYFHGLSKRNVFILNEQNNTDYNLGEYYAKWTLNQTVKAVKCQNINLFRHSMCVFNKHIILGKFYTKCSEGNYYLQLEE